MWKKLALALVVLVAGFVAFVATRPADYRVSRSAAIAAPPGEVWAVVSDLGRWDAWSPWSKLDPAMRKEVTGAPGAVGHAYHWAGNSEVGEGRLTLTAARPGATVAYRLEFIEPFASVAVTEFAVAPDAGGSRVTWTMSGENDFMGKLWGTFMPFEEAIGADFERGLAQLKQLAEAAPRR